MTNEREEEFARDLQTMSFEELHAKWDPVIGAGAVTLRTAGCRFIDEPKESAGE